MTKLHLSNKNVSTTSLSLERYPSGKKNPHPWHRDFGPHPNDVGPDKLGGSVELAKRVGRDRSKILWFIFKYDM